MRAESDIERDFKQWCKDREILCLKLVLLNERGFPDRMLLDKHGNVAFIELKRADGKPSAMQRIWKKILSTEYGYPFDFAYSLAEAIAFARLELTYDEPPAPRVPRGDD